MRLRAHERVAFAQAQERAAGALMHAEAIKRDVNEQPGFTPVLKQLIAWTVIDLRKAVKALDKMSGSGTASARPRPVGERS